VNSAYGSTTERVSFYAKSCGFDRRAGLQVGLAGLAHNLAEPGPSGRDR
ncbi:hypothetical protein PAT3040_06736, partial [Paenibacillus agaridevorans]